MQVEQKTVDQLFEEASCGLHGKRDLLLLVSTFLFFV